MIGVHGHAKQGAGFGYNQVRGLNALLATLTVPEAAPVIVAQRLRKGRAPQPAARNGWSPTRSTPPAGILRRAHRCWCGWTPPYADIGIRRIMPRSWLCRGRR